MKKPMHFKCIGFFLLLTRICIKGKEVMSFCKQIDKKYYIFCNYVKDACKMNVI